jgi:hypothetical protein
MRGSVGNSGNQGGKRLGVFRLGVSGGSKICRHTAIGYNPHLLPDKCIQTAQETGCFFWRFVIGGTSYWEYTPDILQICKEYYVYTLSHHY